MVHRLDRPPGSDEKVTATVQDVGAGGPAANAALTFAILGGSATLVTALGRHPLAAAAVTELAGYGVDLVDLTPDAAESPAVSAVRVEARTGRRSVSSPDAASRVPAPAPTDDAIAAWLAVNDVVLLDGHHAETAPPVARAARAAGVPVLLDGGRWRPVFGELLAAADFAIVSADFAVPAGFRGPKTPDDSPDAQDVLTSVLALGADAAARSAGPEPIRWAVPGSTGRVEVAVVEAMDTLGAGDVLHGAAALAIAAVGAGPGLALWPEVLRFAADVASVRVGYAGPRSWIADPRLPELVKPWTG